jgi:NTP pyrophosphatase (non-canonical NTP hydrolase)
MCKRGTRMEFNEYQEKALATAVYPNVSTGTLDALMYCALGLCGEAGEIAEKVKKLYRDSNGVITKEARTALLKEMGDPLWYLAAMANELCYTMEEVAQTNVDKLQGRRNRGTLSGSGDDR